MIIKVGSGWGGGMVWYLAITWAGGRGGNGGGCCLCGLSIHRIMSTNVHLLVKKIFGNASKYFHPTLEANKDDKNRGQILNLDPWVRMIQQRFGPSTLCIILSMVLL